MDAIVKKRLSGRLLDQISARSGLGAAFSLAAALVVESGLLFIVITKRPGLHIWIWDHG